MKKAKQILALMLVVVMALGMMVFTTASAKNVGDYPDADSIEYKEAVDVLTALGVFVGDDDGKFGPQANFTREQAAKIITYILVGSASADRLAHRATSFTDVATDRWSNPYIEYCVEKGLILGYGDGRFGPADPVTASQMAKWLLMAIGYGAQGEYNNPESWELNVVVDGQKRGILTTDEDYTKPATREQVAQYTFNALTDDENAFLVTYSDLTKQYMTSGSTFISSAIATTLGAETFRLVKNEKVDALGHSVREWKIGTSANANALTSAYRTDVTLFSTSEGIYLTGSTSNMQTLSMTTPGSMYFKARLLTFDSENIEVYVNGTDYSGGVGYANSAAAAAQMVPGVDGTTPISVDALCYTKGVTVELIDRNDDGNADKVVIIKKTVGTVLANPSVDAFGTTTIPGVYFYTGGSASSAFSYGRVQYPSDLKAGDIVLYYEDATITGGVTHIEKAQSVSGTFTAFNKAGNAAMDTATIGGTAYYVSGLDVSSGKVSSPYEQFYAFTNVINNFHTTVTAYLDDGKNIIGFVPGEEATLNYLISVSAPVALGHSAQIEVVMSDGTHSVIDVVTFINSSGTAVSTGVSGLLATNTIYSYTANANGKYTLKYEAPTYSAASQIDPRAAFDSTNVGNDATVFVVYNGSSYKVYTGVKNVPQVTGLNVINGGSNTVVMAVKSGFAKFVYVYGTPSVSSKNMLFFPNISTYGTASLNNDGLKYYTLGAVNPETGAVETKTLTASAYQALLQGSASVATYAEIGYGSGDVITDILSVTATGPYVPNSTFCGTGVLDSAKNGVIKFNTGTYRYDGNTKVYSINLLFGSASVSTMSSIAADPSTTYFGKQSTAADSPDLITELYIIPADQAIWLQMYTLGTLDITGLTAAHTKTVKGTTTVPVLEAAIYANAVVQAEFHDGSTEALTPGLYAPGTWVIAGYYDGDDLATATAVALTSDPGGTDVIDIAVGTYYAFVLGFTSAGGAVTELVPITVELS